MFSNTIKYAIEETIKDFNIWLNKNGRNNTDVDIKNAFYQRLKTNFRYTEWNGIVNGYDFNISYIKLKIENNVLTNLRFEIKDSKYYSPLFTNFIDNCMREIVLIDYESLEDEMKVYELDEVFTKAIGQINNFKINK